MKRRTSDRCLFSLEAVNESILWRFFVCRLFAISIGASLVGPIGAAEPVSLGPADTSSPRATLTSFIDSCNQFYAIVKSSKYFNRDSPEHRPIAMRVLDCLDASEVPEFERMEYAGEAAICIKEVLDRSNIPPLDQVPDSDTITQWRVPGTRLTIVKVDEGSQRHEFLFSPGTVNRAIELYEDVKPLPYRETGPPVTKGFYDWYISAPGTPLVGAIVSRFPDWGHRRINGVVVWKLIGLGLSIFVMLVVLFVLYRIHLALLQRYRQTEHLWAFVLTIATPILATYVPVYFREWIFNQLTLRGQVLYVASFMANLLSLCILMIVVFGVGNRLAAIITASPRIAPGSLDAQFVRILCRLLSVIAAVVIFLEGGRYLGIPVTTLLASAGVGGLAIALAAQDTLRTLFGTIMLLTDKPFRSGDRIVFGRYDGVVESIGLRSTRLRLLTGHQATVPNDELSRTDIENIGRRPHIRRSMVLELPASTPVAKVRRALEIVRSALEDHEGMDEEFPPRVYLRDFRESAVGIYMVYWYHPPDYWDFLAFSESINLEIMEKLEAEQIPYCAPALTIEIPEEEKPQAK